ncbi:hypothetical protein, partial [Cupriavidus sp. WS]|uniref:hypothetical protein n=1 Tax=Cupriavidus sp. WS TaxID=1312922 RepID=UPI0012DC16F0
MSTVERQSQLLNVKIKVNFKVKGFRSPGATYFLFPEKKVGKESGLPGRQGQSRTGFLGVVVSWWGLWFCWDSAGTGSGGHYLSGDVRFVVALHDGGGPG